MRIPLMASIIALGWTATAYAVPSLQIRAFDQTGVVGNGNGTAINLNSISFASGTLTAGGTSSNFSSIQVSTSGAENSNGGLSTTTLDASGIINTTLRLQITQTDLPVTQVNQPFQLSFTLNALTNGANGNVTFSSYVDAADTAYGMSTPLVAGQMLNSNSIVNTFTTTATAANFTIGSLYSETQVLDINFASTGSVSASSQIVPVPEPASLTLLGIGVASLVAARRRRSA